MLIKKYKLFYIIGMFYFNRTTLLSMREAVGTIGGIKYGFKLFGYFLAVFFLGGIISVIGIAIAVDGVGSPTTLSQPAVATQGPNFGQLLIGGAISLLGSGVSFAGVVGAIYKVIADSHYHAQLEAQSITSGLSESVCLGRVCNLPKQTAR
jgi:hypothetical protein